MSRKRAKIKYTAGPATAVIQMRIAAVTTGNSYI